MIASRSVTAGGRTPDARNATIVAARPSSVRGRRAARSLAAAFVLAAVGGCATITRGVTQDIQVATDPAGAACELSLDGALVDTVPATPGFVRVRKGLATYVLACRCDGYLDSATRVEAGIEDDAVGGMTMGALTGLQGTTGATVTSTALSAVLPAATAATSALVIGVAGAVSFAVDLASGAMFEYPTTIALTLVPVSFENGEARDRFFDREEARVRAKHATHRAEIEGQCTRVRCPGTLASIDRALERELAELDRLRATARVRG